MEYEDADARFENASKQYFLDIGRRSKRP